MPRKLTQNEFVEKSNSAHKFKYDYSLAVYDGGHTKVKIICPVHGVFEQKPNDHMRGIGCARCHGYMTTEIFVEKALGVHGDKYDYSVTEYTNIFKSVSIGCKDHGVFKQSPKNHLRGQGCPECGKAFRHGHKKEKYIDACRARHDGKSSLYLIECWNSEERFYKVGITTKEKLKRRMSGVHMPYSWREVEVIRGDCGLIWDMEAKIHGLLKPFRYKPSIKFHGHTECFTKIPNSILKLVRKVNKSNQMQLLV